MLVTAIKGQPARVFFAVLCIFQVYYTRATATKKFGVLKVCRMMMMIFFLQEDYKRIQLQFKRNANKCLIPSNKCDIT